MSCCIPLLGSYCCNDSCCFKAFADCCVANPVNQCDLVLKVYTDPDVVSFHLRNKSSIYLPKAQIKIANLYYILRKALSQGTNEDRLKLLLKIKNSEVMQTQNAGEEIPNPFLGIHGTTTHYYTDSYKGLSKGLCEFLTTEFEKLHLSQAKAEAAQLRKLMVSRNEEKEIAQAKTYHQYDEKKEYDKKMRIDRMQREEDEVRKRREEQDREAALLASNPALAMMRNMHDEQMAAIQKQTEAAEAAREAAEKAAQAAQSAEMAAMFA